MYLNGYRCFACCEVQSADFSGFLCPSCGHNLEVTYDYAAAETEFVKGLGNCKRDLFRYQPLLPVNIPAAPFPSERSVGSQCGSQ